ncbi:MAG: transposase [Actinobacteria bacterium]|nr:transposase [Actinomycetota bacterium]
MVYVGMDVHRKRTQVAVLDERGVEVLNRNLPNDPGELAPLLSSLGNDVSVVFEAAYGWGWLADLLGELHVDTHLAHAKNVKAIASALKNDKVDARTLAHLLRTDLLPEAWLAPREVRDLRALLRHRARLVRYGTSLKTRIHAVLADQGIRVEVPRLWTGLGRAWLDALDLPPLQREIVEDLLVVLDATTTRVKRLEREIKELAQPDERVTALQKLPGHRLAERHDAGRRDRRHRPFRDIPQALCVGWIDTSGAQLRPHDPPRSHHQAWDRRGSAESSGKLPTWRSPNLRSP